MTEYVVYVNVDQIRMGTEQSVTTSLMRCGFRRATHRGADATPLATLLFLGHSALDEFQLARLLEKDLRYDTMCDVHVIVFQLSRLRSRPVLQPPSIQIVHSEMKAGRAAIVPN